MSLNFRFAVSIRWPVNNVPVGILGLRKTSKSGLCIVPEVQRELFVLLYKTRLPSVCIVNRAPLFPFVLVCQIGELLTVYSTKLPSVCIKSLTAPEPAVFDLQVTTKLVRRTKSPFSILNVE